MKQLTYLMVAFIILRSIDQTFSALLFDLQLEWGEKDYFSSKSASVHRGLALSYSSAQKNQICQDIFYAQLYVIPELTHAGSEISTTSWINDGQTIEGKPNYPLIVNKFEGEEDDDRPPSDLEEIFFRCVGENFNSRKPSQTSKYLVYTAYRRGWWYGNLSDIESGIKIERRFYVGLSPEYVQMDQKKLEQQYLNIQKTKETLEKESPEYMKLIEKRDALSSLSVFRKLALCASILTSPIYRVDRLEFSLEWMEQNRYEMALGFETNELTFTESVSENLPFKGFICKGFVNTDTRDSDSTSLFITQAYDDKDSVYVVEHKDEYFILSKYFKNIPLLINHNERLDEGLLYANYDEH